MNKNRSLVTLSVQRLSEAFKEVCKGKAERNNEILYNNPLFNKPKRRLGKFVKENNVICVLDAER
jgi:hypothetical protein